MNAISKAKSVIATSKQAALREGGNEEFPYYAAQIMAEAWMLQEQALLENPLIYIESFMDSMMNMGSPTKAELATKIYGMLPFVRPATIRGMLNLKYDAIA